MSLDGINSNDNNNLKLPNQLNLSQFDEITKRILSVFDTDKEKGVLSKSEIQNALFKLAGEKDVTGNIDYSSFMKNHEGLVDDVEDLSPNGKKVNDYINNAYQALLKAIGHN